MGERRLRLSAVAVLLGLVAALIGKSGAQAADPLDISTSCAGNNAEVEQAADPAANNVYEIWMGCSGIFARSTDGGAHFSAPVSVPGSVGSDYNSWDPSVAVAPNGAVYASFMLGRGGQWYPVVAKSTDHGRTFPQVTQLVPPDPKNWGDREFVQVAPDGSVYLTYDYGPNRTSITFLCSASGSCGYATGDVNVVLQKSIDGGKTFSAMSYISPGFPASGGDSAPFVIEPKTGKLDVLFQDYPISDTATYAMGLGISEFTSSSDGGANWSKPVQVGPTAGTMSLAEWWIDGDVAMDAGGNLYAAWDTQSDTTDTGWLSMSADHGRTWSAPLQGPVDTKPVPHIMEVTGGDAGVAHVSWLSDSDPSGYAMYLRTYSLKQRGWVGDAARVSAEYGDPAVWPGDTFGISQLGSNVVLSWGSATPSSGKKSDIFVTSVPVSP